MKTNKFEEIIATSITRLKSTLSSSDLQSLQQQLSALPKKIKELKADPYLFIFELMLKRKELIEPALTALTTMLDENYLTAPLYDQLLSYLPPLLQDYSYSIVQLISKVKEPHLGFLKLYFDVHSSVALPEDQLKKFKSQGYMWLARAFSLTDRPLDTLAASLYAKFYPEQMPKLLKVEEEQQQIRKYVTLVIDQTILAVEFALQGGQRGKYGCCFICKQLAEYYCKDTKVPVCSVQCKKGHLQLLAKTNSLNFQYSNDFCKEIQSLLVSNLRQKRSPALSIDFLIAVYQYSSYIPQIELQHLRIMSQPVIFERIWLLYFSYYSKLGQQFEHIFYSGLTVQNQFLKQMCTQYFILLASQPRLFSVYKAFDQQGDYRLLTSVLRSLDPSRKIEFISSFVETVFNNYSSSSYRIEDQQRSIIRALNHQQVLTPESLTGLFGENAHLKLIRFIMRNELEVNRQKLGEFLFSNQQICRLFLREVVERKLNAPVDQLIREVFFFVNVKISDKIYRLFELLAEIYQPQPPFNQTNFFTYAYFIIMIVTELNNPIVTQKPTISTILTRVEQFCPDLAKNHAHIIQAMFQRISTYPFSQNSRGILSYYPPVAILPKSDLHVEEIIINNWEFIYEAVLNGRIESIVLYRICSLVVAYPHICQAFLQILVERLTEENRDQFLVKTIANILEQQPNAAGFLWKPILEEVRSSPSGPAPDQFSLSLIIHSSPLLTDDNFYQFVREFSAQFPIVNYINYYMQLIIQNKMRTGLVSTLLVSNFEKCGNWYLQLVFARKVGHYLEEQPETNICSMLLQMLRMIPVNVITEGLMLQCLLSIDFEKFPKALEFWTVVSHKCLLFSDDKKVAILEQALRQSRCPEAYQSYLIQKTLNCPSQQLISEDILKNLHKLQPYLDEIDPQLLKLFLLKQNLPTVLSNFKYFRNINESYAFIVKQLEEWSEEKLSGVIEAIKNLLQNSFPLILELDSLPAFMLKALAGCPQSFMPLLIDYVRLLQINQNEQQTRAVLMKITNISIFANSFVGLISNSSLHLQRQFVSQLIHILQFLHIQSNLFQTNISLRLDIKKLLQSSHLPSSLKSSLLLCKSRYYFQDSLQHPSEISLIQLLKQVQIVVQRQMKISLQEKGAKLSNLERLQLIQSNKDSMLYGQMMIEASHQYISSKGSLTTAHRSLLKGIIISILVQGFFNEATSSYDSLADSPLAHKAAQIIHLLNQS